MQAFSTVASLTPPNSPETDPGWHRHQKLTLSVAAWQSMVWTDQHLAASHFLKSLSVHTEKTAARTLASPIGCVNHSEASC